MKAFLVDVYECFLEQDNVLTRSALLRCSMEHFGRRRRLTWANVVSCCVMFKFTKQWSKFMKCYNQINLLDNWSDTRLSPRIEFHGC